MAELYLHLREVCDARGVELLLYPEPRAGCGVRIGGAHRSGRVRRWFTVVLARYMLVCRPQMLISLWFQHVYRTLAL